MKADPKHVTSGTFYMDGDIAAGRGALAAGCRFIAGYPITPSTEAAESFAKVAPMAGAMFIQMEDELGSVAAVVGGAWAGVKTMTITSGPGYSLMMETVGLSAMMETPLVLLNVQRAGPSTGVPTKPGQGDIMQSRWGSHGDYEVIAIAPVSPQELFDYTVKAFNLAETYRCPVMVMTDECVGHMTEKVVIPPAEEIDVVPRDFYEGPPEEYKPYKPEENLVPKMAKAGDGMKLYVTAQAHDENGHPVTSETYKSDYTKRLVDKIRRNKDDIIELREYNLEDAEIAVVAYGISSRVAVKGIELAREKGIKVGQLRLVTVWPFPDERIRELAKKVKAFVVPEINYGQVVFEVARCAEGEANVVLVGHGGAGVTNPEDIAAAIEYAAGEEQRLEGVVDFKTKLERKVFEEGGGIGE